jgi:hypothetical protein
LLKGCPEGTQGIIGQVARERLKQIPRIVYWNGTAVFGIRRFPGSIRQYFQSLDSFYRRQSREVGKEDDPEAFGRAHHNWDPALPSSPDGWAEGVTLDLTMDEAQYLVDRAKTSIGGTLLAELITRGEPLHADLPWLIDDQGRLPSAVRNHLSHARWFSETILGAQLLYNLMVAQAIARDGGDGTYADDYRYRLELWAGQAEDAAEERASWDRADFWRLVLNINPRVPPRARQFIDDWLDAVDRDPSALIDDGVWRERLVQREYQLKKGLARLSNTRARETWGGATGAGQLSFRWPEASTAITDIAHGLAAP